MPDDHSEVVPLLPIPNRTVKRFCADDSAGSRVKVGHRQAITVKTPPRVRGRFFLAFVFDLITLPGGSSAPAEIRNQKFRHFRRRQLWVLLLL